MNPSKLLVQFRTDSNGAPKMMNRAMVDAWFKKNPDTQFTGEIKKVGKRHSDRLRAYYFAEVVQKMNIALKGAGYNFTQEETHQFIKQFSPVMTEVVEVGNYRMNRYKSFRDPDFNNTIFLEYISDIQRFAAEELDIIINDPNESDKIDEQANLENQK